MSSQTEAALCPLKPDMAFVLSYVRFRGVKRTSAGLNEMSPNDAKRTLSAYPTLSTRAA
jgi:hypothetical protein